MDRRRFLMQLGGFAAVPGLAPLLAGCAALSRTPVEAKLSAASRATLEAVQAQLLPSEPDAPGAREVNAAGYFQSLLRDHRLAAAERAFLLRGLNDVERLAQAKTGRRFAALDAAEREVVLRAVEQTAEGGRWLGEMLGYLMEALLADPVYGGNPGGVGWNWLAHTPGFPRPPADKRYFLL
jgi:gluconate 2-dehydrogenase gamma chain